MIPSLKLTCETLGLGWMSFVLGFGLLAGSMLILGSVFTLWKELGTSQDCLWTPVTKPTCYCFTAMNMYKVTDVKLSRETLRYPVSNSVMLYMIYY